MTPKFFSKPADFRKWLKANHHKKKELWVGFYKLSSGKPSMTWSESVDEALCFGWIDGIRKSIDNESYTNRFTPRKQGSNWSAINIRKVDELTKKGLMQTSGLEIFENRDKTKEMVYSFENGSKNLSPPYLKKFKTNKTAWDFFKTQAPSYQKLVIFWIMTAKREATQLSRLEKVIVVSLEGKRI